MENISWETLVSLVQSKGLVTLFVLSLANIAIGATVAFQERRFKLYLLAEDLRKVIPYIVAYIVVLFMGNPPLEIAIFTAIIATQTSAVMKNLALLFPSVATALPNMTLSPQGEAVKAARRH